MNSSLLRHVRFASTYAQLEQSTGETVCRNIESKPRGGKYQYQLKRKLSLEFPDDRLALRVWKLGVLRKEFIERSDMVLHHFPLSRLRI